MSRQCPKCGAKGWLWSKVRLFGKTFFECMGCDSIFE